ncbi:MAG TPA: hypothetical protein VGN42_05560 [Pirellulales bacterium]|jgi:hypothetical protein|nr:hypothetical protein [Pirellulales bacterium]
MQRPVSVRLIAAQLLLTSGVLALVAVSVVGITDDWQVVGLLGGTLGLSALLGLWSGLSKAAILQRVGVAVIGGLLNLATLATAFRMVQPDRLDSEWILAAVFSMAPLIAIGMFAAILKWRDFSVERPGLDDKDRNQHVQFSLAYLFAVISLAAILFAVIRELRDLTSFSPEFAWEICLFAAFNGVLFVLHTQVCLWAGLGAGRRIARLGAALASTALAAGVYGFALGGDGGRYQICIELMAIYSVLVTGSLLALRRLGYRLLRAVQPNAPLDDT